mgnify:CR=1 FL=1
MRLHKRMILGLAAGTLTFALSACSSQGNNQTETPQAASEASETDPSQEAVSSEEGIAETTAGLVQGDRPRRDLELPRGALCGGEGALCAC